MSRDIVNHDGRVLLSLTGEQVEALGLDGATWALVGVGGCAYAAEVDPAPGGEVRLSQQPGGSPAKGGDVVTVRRTGSLVRVGMVR